MGTISVGVCDSNVVFETGVLSCLAGDPTIVASRFDPRSEQRATFDVMVVSLDHVDEAWADCPLVVCVDEPENGRDLTGRTDIVAVLSRSSVTPDQLAGAVHAAGVGLRMMHHKNGSSPFDDRSLTVLRLLAEGANTSDISTELGYSERTVKSVISTIGARLGSRTRAQAVATALRQSLIS